jgi:hypothetical protein
MLSIQQEDPPPGPTSPPHEHKQSASSEKNGKLSIKFAYKKATFREIKITCLEPAALFFT